MHSASGPERATATLKMRLQVRPLERAPATEVAWRKLYRHATSVGNSVYKRVRKSKLMARAGSSVGLMAVSEGQFDSESSTGTRLPTPSGTPRLPRAAFSTQSSSSEPSETGWFGRLFSRAPRPADQAPLQSPAEVEEPQLPAAAAADAGATGRASPKSEDVRNLPSTDQPSADRSGLRPDIVKDLEAASARAGR